MLCRGKCGQYAAKTGPPLCHALHFTTCLVTVPMVTAVVPVITKAAPAAPAAPAAAEAEAATAEAAAA